MTYPWFRMYTEAVNDPKLRLLAFEDRWHFVAFLCCKGMGLLDQENEQKMRRQVAVTLGLDLRELDEVARRLSDADLIDRETFQPLAWEERQCLSDSSKERTRKWRERKKKQYVDDIKRHGDVTVTAQEEDIDTDKDLYEVDIKTSTSLPERPPKKAKPPIPMDEIVELYHKHLPQNPRVRILSGKRESHIRQRWRDNLTSLEAWESYFSAVAKSPFLTGKVTSPGRKPFRAEFDWLIQEHNLVKVYEGKYHG